jgi:UDP-glucuronate decarboxylase
MTAGLNGFRGDDLDAAMARAAPSLTKLTDARIFITGGTGFIGQWLLALLAHARAQAGLNFSVDVLTRDAKQFLDNHKDFDDLDWLRFTNGDIRSFTFPSGHFTHVIHAATDTNAAADRRLSERAATIIDGTRRVLDFCAKASVGRLLTLSSGAVYGRQPADVERIDETFAGGPDPLDTRAVYGESKRAAEMFCAIAAAAGVTQTVSARIFAAVGPGLPLDEHFAIGNFIRDAMSGGEIRVGGDGTPLRSYIYASDLAAWLLTLLVEGHSGAAYNVGSDEVISIADLAGAVRDVVAPDNVVAILGKLDPTALRSRYVPSIDRARRELGLAIWTSLDVAIGRTAEHARSIARPDFNQRKRSA